MKHEAYVDFLVAFTQKIQHRGDTLRKNLSKNPVITKFNFIADCNPSGTHPISLKQMIVKDRL